MEEKIRYLIRKFPHTEWSGVLFYTYQGTFENKDIVITCQDIYPMDLGDVGFTSFNMNEDVAKYLTDNMDLFDCQMGLVHSHHNMGAFFSGQDLKTLQEQGNEMNNFVSLIVDTKGTYVAAITRKVTVKYETITKILDSHYEFFGDGAVDYLSGNKEDITKTVDTQFIEYYMLEVEREEVSNPLEYLDKRFEEINTSKNIVRNEDYGQRNIDWWRDAFSSTDPYEEARRTVARCSQGNQLRIPFEEDARKAPKGVDRKYDMGNPTIDPKEFPDPKLVSKMTAKILALSLNLNTDKFNTKQWVRNHMANVYKKVFDVDEWNYDVTDTLFDNWLGFSVPWVLDSFEYPPFDNDKQEEEARATVIEAFCKELEMYEKDCRLVRHYIDMFECYY